MDKLHPDTSSEQPLERIAHALEVLAAATPGTTDRAPAGAAFVWRPREGFRAVRRPAGLDPDLLVGIDRQKQAFLDNLGRFLSGRPAHDVLLWGERGCGKSSLVRSLLHVFADQPLALVELAEPDIPQLPRLLDALDGDPRRWVLCFDDLSFAGPGELLREFKILLEGGIEVRPENTLAVATSNRRHLLPEVFAPGNEIHPEETVAETVSLADRFGLSLGFYAMDQATYLQAVSRHLALLGVQPPPAGWQDLARQWAMARGIRSGRSALQAARDIAGALPRE